MNINDKLQSQSDQLKFELGLPQFTVVPQLFYVIKIGKFILLAEKIVHKILVTGENNGVYKFLAGFDEKFKFLTIVHGPGNIRFSSLDIVQN